MTKRLTIAFLIMFPFFSFGQDQQLIDSLKQVIETATHDTTKVKTLNTLAKELLYSKPQKAKEYANKALVLAQKANWIKGMADSHNELGIYHYTQSDYHGTLDHWLKALELHEDSENKSGMATILNNIGLVYKQQSDYPKAQDYYFKSLKINEELGNKSVVAATLGNIGIIYAEQSNYTKALDYYFKSLKIKEELGDKRGMATTLSNIGLVYMDQSEYPKALDHYFKSLKLNEEIGDKRIVATTLGNIGIVYKHQSDYPKALDYYYKALKKDKEIGNKNGISRHFGNIGLLYIITGKYKKAEEYLQKALALSDEIGEIYHKNHIYSHFSDLYSKTGRHKKALDMYKKHIELRDSINSEENQKELMQREMQFEYEKKAAIDSIAHTKQMEIKDVKLAKQDAEIEVKRNQQYALFGGLALVLIFAGFMYNRFRVTRRQKAVIEEQKTAVEQQKGVIEEQKLKIEEKHKEVTDSINYAKRIQEAILPSLNSMHENLKDGFVLYKPKDVVAGDFYWLELHENKVYFAAADCTGHGVPGAMVSVVCSNALSKALLEENCTETGKLLDRTRELVIERLAKSGEEVKDGMDISLCAIDFKNMKLQWSGANNPLWIIRKNNEGLAELVEVKHDKQAIGIQFNAKPFTSHNIELQKGDKLYVFTDGYQDQFGGEKGKKFKPKQLKEKLLSIQEKSMDEQKDALDKEFESWRGNLEQIDDVCMIGVRI